MEDNEMLEQTNETENVETQSTEQIEEGIDFTDTEVSKVVETETVTEADIAPVKKKVEFTEEQQAEIDRIAAERARREANKKDREYSTKISKYENIIEKLKIGMEKDSIEDIDSELTNFYVAQGKTMPTPKANERDEQILAKADVNEIIETGKEEMERIANEIANKPIERRSVREKTILAELVKELVIERAKTDLETKGIDTKILDNAEFKQFSSKFSPEIPMSEVYELYSKTKTPINTQATTPKPLGSVKSNVANNEIKEYYTKEEISKFTKEDYLNNPRLMAAVENSLAKK